MSAQTSDCLALVVCPAPRFCPARAPGGPAHAPAGVVDGVFGAAGEGEGREGAGSEGGDEEDYDKLGYGALGAGDGGWDADFEDSPDHGVVNVVAAEAELES